MVSWSAYSTTAHVRKIWFSSRMFHAFRGQEIPTNNALFLKANMGRIRPYIPISKFIFTKEYLKKHFGVMPMIGLKAIWAVGVIGYSCYAIATRDVVFDKSKKPFWSRMDLQQPYSVKMITINEKYKPMKKLDFLYRVMDGEELDEAEFHDEE